MSFYENLFTYHDLSVLYRRGILKLVVDSQNSSASSRSLWFYEKASALPSTFIIFCAPCLSLHRNGAVFLRKSVVLLRNKCCGQTEICCPYTEKGLSFYGSPFRFISDIYINFPDFSLTYVSKYIYAFLLTTTELFFMSLHESVVLLNQGVFHAK